MRKKNYRVVQSSEDLNEFFDYLKEDNEFIAFDIETNGVNERTCRVVGISVTAYIDEGWYLPLAIWDHEKQVLNPTFEKEEEQEIIEDICKLLLKRKLIMHNGIFDILCMFYSYGVDLTPALFCDTILLKHTVDEEHPFGLKEIASRYQEKIGIPAEDVANQEQEELKESVKERGGKWTKENKEMFKADFLILGKYACADVDLTLRVFEYFEERLIKEELAEFFYEKEVMPLYKKVTIPMKKGGVFVDVEYFKKLEKEVECDIIRLTEEVFKLIEPDIQDKVKDILDEAVRATKSGKFAERILQHYNIPVPVNKRSGKPTLAKSVLQSLSDLYPDHPALKWLLYKSEPVEACPLNWVEDHWEHTAPEVIQEDPNEPALPESVLYEVKKQIYVERKPGLPYVFNLASSKHLSWLVFERYKQEPLSFSRKTGAAQVDKKSLVKYDLPFIKVLSKLRKEEKLLSTYVKPILEKHENGWLFPAMLQFGTTSGRYSCAGGLNLQTLPKDDKRVKKGFIAPKGYKVVNADFSSLEPRIFSWVSGDEGLKRVYKDDLDLYSQVAIDVFGLTQYSAKEGDKNFLKDAAKEWRDKSKVFTLAVVYGANAHRIAELMKITPDEAQKIIDSYLEAYPNLKMYMQDQEETVVRYGKVYTAFGRVRHLPDARRLYSKYGDLILNKLQMALLFAGPKGRRIYEEQIVPYRRTKNKKKQELAKKAREQIMKLGSDGVDLYFRFRNYLNNAKNFPIQSTAAHVTNAALIKLADAFDKNNVKGWIALQIHDEICTYAKEDETELVSRLLQDAMENNTITKKIDIPMIAKPIVADNFAEAKD